MSYRITIGKEATTVENEENILDAVSRAKIKSPKSCRNGNCMICEAVLIEGSVSQSYQDKNGSKKFIPCKSIALSDCHFSFLHRQYTDEHHRLACQVLDIKPNGSNWQLYLRLPAGKLQLIDTNSIDLIGDKKYYSSLSAQIEHRNLTINISYRPDLYIKHRLAYIHYQLL